MTALGAPADTDGVRGSDEADQDEAPAAFRAATSKTYAVSFVSPVAMYAAEDEALFVVAVDQDEPPLDE